MLQFTAELVSVPEYRLIQTIEAVRYGELFGVEIPEQTPESTWIKYELTPAEHDLIEFIRAGAQYIDVLTIHNGQPAMAETDFKLNGFRCRKKVKFPTVHTEG